MKVSIFHEGGPRTVRDGDRVYENAGNADLIALVDRDSRVVLDVGCGAGDNARLLRARNPSIEIYGITRSPAEAERAVPQMRKVFVADLERGLPAEARALRYDAIVFSHVLEHLREPARLLAEAAACLRPGGACAIAVPNAVVWSQRVRVLFGDFRYEQDGLLDRTHLRFYTFETAVPELLAQAPVLEPARVTVSASVPLWLLRRYLLPSNVCARIDALGGRLLPNLFGSQILIEARKRG